MLLLTVKRKFIKELTLVGLVLTGVVALVYHMFIPERYFLWFPAIPVFFYLVGLLYIAMFLFCCRTGDERLALTYMTCKAVKFILSAVVMIFYGFVIGHEVIAFIMTFMFFYFSFLIFETRFFLQYEAELKQEKKTDNEKNTVHNDDSAPAGSLDGHGRNAK